MIVAKTSRRRLLVSEFSRARLTRGSPELVAISIVDLTIVLVYTIAVVIFGMWIGRGQTELSGYLLGGRDLPWWAIMGSIVATETSTATFLSVPGLSFSEGGDLRFLQLALGFCLGRIIVVVVLLPLYFRGQLFSAYEVLDKRFGVATKRVASLMFLIARNLGDGLRLFLAGIVLQQVAGFELFTCIIIMGLLTIIYTFFGGMKAIVWTDCIQFVVYVGGAILAGILILRQIPGGWDAWMEYGRSHDKFRLFDFSFDHRKTMTIWSGLIGGAMLTLGTHGTDQMMVQRYLSARGLRDAGLALIGSGVIVVLQFALFLFVGTALACFYTHFPPKTPFDRADQVFATYIATQMPIGVIGILLAAVSSAAMSTLSSSLNSSASALVSDFYLPLRKIDFASKHALYASQVFTILFGVIQISVGIAASYLSRSVVNDALAIAGFTAGILLGLFALGVLTTSVDQRGALVGMTAGLLVLTYVKFGTDLAWPWYAIVGSVTVFVVGLLAAKILGSKPKPANLEPDPA